jgi:hypothetical protein
MLIRVNAVNVEGFEAVLFRVTNFFFTWSDPKEIWDCFRHADKLAKAKGKGRQAMLLRIKKAINTKF